MNAIAVPLLSVFEKKLRLEVPLFQRQYVWSRDHQWQPLWDDIERKFSEYLEGRKEAPVHFLGAMVLDQKQTPITHVERRQVIDGQQRLTTLHLVLAAFRDFCQDRGHTELASEFASYTLNRGLMADPEVDRFKVWPTKADRQQFQDVMAGAGRDVVLRKYPLVKRKYARTFEPRPRMVEAYLFFYDQFAEFFEAEDPNGGGDTRSLAERIEECLQALRSALCVVVIDLDQGDDAQVIFETLNARGEPLLPADLLRNYIFLRAARRDENPEDLYNRYWSDFDDDYWREEVRQGRLSRPRSDLFMQHFLTSRIGRDVPIRHLFVEYKFWIHKSNPFKTVEEELGVLARQGAQFRRFMTPEKRDVLFPLLSFLDVFDMSTVYPFLLAVADDEPSEDTWKGIARVVESYLLRRAVCGLPTKNYTRNFLSLTRAVQRDGVSVDTVMRALGEFHGDPAVWPTDEQFAQAWHTIDAYRGLRSDKVAYILQRLNETYSSAMTEQISIDVPLSVEHLMPQNWVEHWLLSDGSKGMSDIESFTSTDDGPRRQASRARHSAVQTFGNLTIIVQPLNSAVSNSSWTRKKPQLLAASLLPINLHLQQYESWDEATIGRRSRDLFVRAAGLWIGPPASVAVER